MSEGETFPLERVQAALPAATAIVGWLDVELTDGRCDSWGYVVRRSGALTWGRCGETGSSPYNVSRAHRDELARPESSPVGVMRQGHALWKARFEPLADALASVRDLVVIPSGAMLGVPVETLPTDGGTLLGDQYAISYTPSATIYAWLRDRSASGPSAGRALVVGDPPFADAHLDAMAREARNGVANQADVRDVPRGERSLGLGLPRLPGSRDEVTMLSEILPGALVLVGPNASEEKLVELAASLRRFLRHIWRRTPWSMTRDPRGRRSFFRR